MDTHKMSSFLHCGCMWLEDKQTLSSVALPNIPAHCMQAELGLPQCSKTSAPRRIQVVYSTAKDRRYVCSSPTAWISTVSKEQNLEKT